MDTKSTKSSELESKAMTIHGSDRRVTPRFRVQFRTFLTNQSTLIEHMGTILDLSVAGCRVGSLVPVNSQR